MRHFIRSVFVGAGLLVGSCTYGQSLDSVISKIKLIDEVHCEGVGIGYQKSRQYENYEEFLRIASVDDLLLLTKDTSGVIACYATWGLIENRYAEIAAIFSNFLRHDKEITYLCGCEGRTSSVSEEIYFRERNVVWEKKLDDKYLRPMDSLILYGENARWLLIDFALKDKVYPASFNKRIEYLAFEKLNADAIWYLKRTGGTRYRQQIKSAILRYLKKTDFKRVGTSTYYDMVSELLSYRDPATNKIIIEKLKTDTHWKHDYGKFFGLLGEYDLEKQLPEY